MYIITHNGMLVAGPLAWSKSRFERIIRDDCEVEITLPQEYVQPVQQDGVQVIIMEYDNPPEYNQRTQILHGPFFRYTGGRAYAYYTPQDKSIDAVKNELIAEVGVERKAKEVAGIEYSGIKVKTDAESRAKILSALSSPIDGTISWKGVAGDWIDLTQEQLSTLNSQVNQHVQNCFNWEKSKVDHINACQTLEELSVVNTKE